MFGLFDSDCPFPPLLTQIEMLLCTIKFQGWQDEDHQQRAHYIVPPDWSSPAGKKKETPLLMMGTSFKEPECPHGWCGTENTIKWSGPGKDGFWIDPNQREHTFVPRRFSAGGDL